MANEQNESGEMAKIEGWEPHPTGRIYLKT